MNIPADVKEAAGRRYFGLPSAEQRAEAFCEGVVAERERCAKILETHVVYYIGTMPSKLVPSSTGDAVGHLFAAAIRNKE